MFHRLQHPQCRSCPRIDKNAWRWNMKESAAFPECSSGTFRSGRPAECSNEFRIRQRLLPRGRPGAKGLPLETAALNFRNGFTCDDHCHRADCHGHARSADRFPDIHRASRADRVARRWGRHEGSDNAMRRAPTPGRSAGLTNSRPPRRNRRPRRAEPVEPPLPARAIRWKSQSELRHWR